MSFKELIINAGSSSLKYQVFEMPEAKVLVGHTPIQVVFGALTGFLTALVYILISI